MLALAHGRSSHRAYPKNNPKQYLSWPLRVVSIFSIYPKPIQVSRAQAHDREFLPPKKTIKNVFKFFTYKLFAETELGKIFARSGWKRSSFVITTKIYWSTKSEERGLSRKHIIESVKASLQRLQLSYIDIVIIYKADSMCPMEGKFC